VELATFMLTCAVLAFQRAAAVLLLLWALEQISPARYLRRNYLDLHGYWWESSGP